jgi:hypothetical protein
MIASTDKELVPMDRADVVSITILTFGSSIEVLMRELEVKTIKGEKCFVYRNPPERTLYFSVGDIEKECGVGTNWQ